MERARKYTVDESVVKDGPGTRPHAIPDHNQVAGESAPAFDEAANAHSLSTFTATLVATLWLGLGGLGLSVNNQSMTQVTTGLLVSLVSGAALWRRRTVASWFQLRPWLVVAVAAADLGAAAVAGLVDSPYIGLTVSSIWIAVVVARSRTVWLCVALLDVGVLALVPLVYSPAYLASHGQIGYVFGPVVAYPTVAWFSLGMRRLFKRFSGNTEGILAAVRAHQTTLPRTLQQAVAREGQARGLILAAPDLRACLTITERRVVEGLARGAAPKELSHAWGVSVATIRSHIQNAKRKTGARTLRELAALGARHHALENETVA